MRHEIFGAIAVILLFISYAVYFRGIWRLQVRPHFFTWLVWTVSVSIGFAAQFSSGAGPGAWTTGLSILFCAGVTVHAFWRGERKFTLGDWVSLLIAFAALPIWYVTHQPAYAAMIVTGIDIVAYYPTFRKSYARPQDENLLSFGICCVRHGFGFFALNKITLATAIYPVGLLIINFVFVVFALWRRHCLTKMAQI